MLIIVQIVLFQGFGALVACASADAATAAGVTVICHAGEQRTGDLPIGSHDCCIDCQCAVACSAGAVLLPSKGFSVAFILPPMRTDLGSCWTMGEAAIGPRAPPPGLPLKRGPPPLSV